MRRGGGQPDVAHHTSVIHRPEIQRLVILTIRHLGTGEPRRDGSTHLLRNVPEENSASI
jgi:hypothetical protein